jgi:hypothetical protein
MESNHITQQTDTIMKKIIGSIAFVLFFFISCEHQSDTTKKTEDAPVHPIIKELRQRYAPDKRVAIFDVAVVEQGRTVTVKGEVGDPNAKEELLLRFRAERPDVLDSIDVLPAANLGEKTWGIITVSVANMRSDPRESAELGTQALMGSIVRIWKKKGGYLYIQTPDKYLGWADIDQMQLVTEQEANEWNNSKRLFFTGMYDLVRQQPSETSYPVCDISAGGVVKDIGESGSWRRIGLADGRVGFIQKKNLIDQKEWGTTLQPVAANIERSGKFMMGVPYLWGGTSAKGVDCSGFTKTVYLLNGVMLDRDANQQAEQGTPVETGTDFSNLKKGDLLFFGRKAEEGKTERITHVGIYLGNREYIHSSGRVQINSFDRSSPLFNEYNLNRYVRARRIIASAPQVTEVTLR